MEEKNEIIKKEKKLTILIKKHCKILLLIILLIGIIIGIISSTIIITFFSTKESISNYEEEIISNYNYIIDNYYEEIDKQLLVDGAITGMLSKLDDEHALFIDQEEDSNFNKTLEGSYEGIGVEVFNDANSDIYILRVFEDSPAAKAGLETLDKIISVNSVNLLGKSSSELSAAIEKIDLDENITIEYERDGKVSKVILQKDYLVIPSVTSKVYDEVDKKIGYIQIEQFSATSYSQFEEALIAVEQSDIDSLIIDVRSNSGGHLSVVEDMLSLFLDSEHILYQIQTQDNVEKFYSTGDENKEYKIIVLQNEFSASASELLASTLNEQANAVIVGTYSYGKGTVQEVVDLDSGNDYKFTSKKWLTSKGNWIDGTGVKPTIEIELSKNFLETFSEADDNQLQKALEEARKK